MKRLNNNGYLLVEIVVASVLAMGIAYFLVRLTINFSKTDEDIYKSISWTNDKNIITNIIMEDIEKYEVLSIENQDENTINFKYSDTVSNTTVEKNLIVNKDDNTITYASETKSIDKSLNIGTITFEKNDSLKYAKITIPITSLYSDEDYGIKLFIYYICPDGYCGEEYKTNLELGDYVSYTPSSKSYTTDTSKTGYSSSQTIDPSELNLWRVLNINKDGTIDLISEYVSSVAVYFYGQTGYLNFVGYLNVLASQYKTEGITTSSRYFGYNSQTEYITDTSKFTTTAPWECSTGESCNSVESQGGGDELYTTDYDQVNKELGTRVAYKVGTTTATEYWVGSRYYLYYSSVSYG